MKKRILLLLVCVVYSAFAKATSKPPQSPITTIDRVTVYLNGAQVERMGTINVTTGTNHYVFEGLSSTIDESSIQVSGLGDATILSINYGLNYLTKQKNSQKVEQLKDQKKLIERKIHLLNNRIQGLKKEEEVISVNQRLGSDVNEIDLEKVKAIATYYRERVTAIRDAILEAEIEKTELQRQSNAITKQFNEFNVTEEVSSGQITLKVNSDINTSLSLRIKYNVSDAGWYPLYDLKAKEINTPLELSYKAHLYQKTGVDWNRCKITLSTGDPNTNNLKPTIDTKYLNFVGNYYKNTNRRTKAYTYKYNPTIKRVTGIVQDENGPLPGANVIISGTSIGTQTDFDGRYAIEVSQGETLVFSYVGFKTEERPIHATIMNVNLDADQTLDEVVVTAYGTKKEKKALGYAVSEVDVARVLSGKAQGVSISNKYTATGDIKTEGLTTTRFEIQKTYSIPSDGDVTVVEIDNFMIPASYQYFTAPLLNENVFLTASIKDWIDYSLLPGEANIYFEGSFSGKTYIDPLETTEDLTISLGVDPNVIVDRKQVDNFKATSFIGTTKIIDHSYVLKIKNSKQTPIQITLLDRVPVSQNKEIKVGDIKTGDAIYKSKTGLLEWKLNLTPNTSVEKTFSYELRYPKHKRINL